MIQNTDSWIKNICDLCARQHVHCTNLCSDRINGNDCGVEHPSQNDLICFPEDLIRNASKQDGSRKTEDAFHDPGIFGLFCDPDF